MDPITLRPFVEAFTSRLLNLGHTRLTVSLRLASEPRIDIGEQLNLW